MHTPYYFFCGSINVYCLPTKYRNLISIALPNFMHVSLSISELHEHAYSIRKGCCLPTSYQNVGVILHVYKVSYIQAFR